MKDYSIFKNLSMAFFANAIGLITSSIITFILPKFIGITDYSYYQLYIFYVSYIGFLTFGLTDGIALRYGGKFFEKVNKSIISTEFRYFTIFETILSLGIVLYTLISRPEMNKIIIYCCIAVCILIYLPRAILHNLLLTTGQIKEFSIMFIIEKLVQIILVIVGLVFEKMYFGWFISADLIGRLLASIYVYYICRKIIFSRHFKPKSSIIFNEVIANIKCGLILMFANIAGMLIIGVIRQFIEISWDIQTFGKISLTLSLSNFILVFISSVSMVLFPIIKRCDKNNLVNLYNSIRTILMMIILFILIFYIPFKYLLSLWLPKYSESLKYMAILFPMCVFECKMNLLVNTYYKSQRMEKLLLSINTLTFILSIIVSYLTCNILHLLDLTVLSIIILLSFRCILSEIILSKTIKIQVKNDILLELILVTVFIFSSWYIDGLKSMIFYLFAYIIYLLIKSKDILQIILRLKKV